MSSWDYWQRLSLLQTSNMPEAVLEPMQNLSSGFVEWSCVVVISTKLWYRYLLYLCFHQLLLLLLSSSFVYKWRVQVCHQIHVKKERGKFRNNLKKKQNKRKTKSKQTLNSIHFDMKLVTETYHVAAEVSE